MSDVTVIGAGPNGLAAAVTLARAGLSVDVIERSDGVGGGARTEALTLSGFVHDVGSAVHPLALASPFFRAFRLAERVPMAVPDLAYAHPLDDGTPVLAWRDIRRTAEGLAADGPLWRRMLGPLARRSAAVADIAGGSVVRIPEHPRVLVQLGLRTLRQGGPWWNAGFADDRAAALLTGVIAHVGRRLPTMGGAAAGMVLASAAHAGGWPIPIGGSGAITAALVEDLLAHGGTIETGVDVRAPADLPEGVVLFDTGASDAVRLGGSRVGGVTRAALRLQRRGVGVAKVDFALDGPVPWRDPVIGRAATAHIGGTRAQIAASEAAVAAGRMPDLPYVVLSEPTAHDPSRAPAGKHVVWSYMHVPNGFPADPVEPITATIERLAPGFRDRVLAAVPTSPADLERRNPNWAGGDIATGTSGHRAARRAPAAGAGPVAHRARSLPVLGGSGARPRGARPGRLQRGAQRPAALVRHHAGATPRLSGPLRRARDPPPERMTAWRNTGSGSSRDARAASAGSGRSPPSSAATTSRRPRGTSSRSPISRNASATRSRRSRST